MATGAMRVLLVGMLASGGALVSYGVFSLLQFLRFRRRERIDDSPLEPGLLATAGVARTDSAGEIVRSPVTGTRALVYEYAVQRRAGSPATPDWRTVVSGQDGVSFVLETDEGRARVEPAGAALELPVVDEIEVEADPDELDADHPALTSLELGRDGDSVVLGGLSLELGHRYRVVERRIEPGDTVPVAGYAAAAGESNPTATPGDDPAVVLRATRSSLRRFFGVPYVIGDAAGGAGTMLRNRAFVGLLFGLPIAMLSLVLLFPP